MTDRPILYEDYERLLAKLAHRYRARLIAQGAPPIDFKDLMQEASIAFIRAREGFKPELGVKFSTYLWRAVSNNLARLAKYRVEQTRGEVSLDEERTEGGSTLHDIIAGDEEAQIDRLDRLRRAEARLARLSEVARKVVLTLDSPPLELTEEVRRQQAFSKLCSAAGYASPVVKLDLVMVCRVLGLDRAARSNVIAEIRALAELNDGGSNGD